jgi:hypothetical protein
MREVKLDFWRRVGMTTAVAAAILLSGCAYKRTMRFPSPSGRAAVEIWQTALDRTFATQIRFVRPDNNVSLLLDRRAENDLQFVQVYWSSDETKAGIATAGLNMYATLAVDVANGSVIPFDAVKAPLADLIAKTYGSPPNGEDPLRWVATYDAATAFKRLHPEIDLGPP